MSWFEDEKTEIIYKAKMTGAFVIIAVIFFVACFLRVTKVI